MIGGRAPGSEKVHAASPPQVSPKGDSASKGRERNPLEETFDLWPNGRTIEPQGPCPFRELLRLGLHSMQRDVPRGLGFVG